MLAHENFLTHRRLNDGLSLAVILLAAYIFLLPFLPQLNWWLDHSAPLVSKAETTAKSVNSDQLAGNRLVVPALGLNETIHTGADVATVDKGVWLRPNASTPDQGSNTVLVGHRFTYQDPQGVFYFLDKLKLNDEITLVWQDKIYKYQVKQISIVDASNVTVEAPTTEKQLTLYTCTPLWSLKDRLVVTASEVTK